ncbi:MAG: ubiquinol-cytochrome c reductase iron-sulfur subunit [Anaerolineales bacterium]|nr:ubiquinol-cytochrome c reductase iron-sulfur subunit [Anaerolineales bacterium]MCB9144432.1 ubiquinol-cytochrome c reductase iron-sulfur subunit [Anaerolineales bacterium]
MSGSHELSRRDFIKVTTGIVGGLIGTMIGLPSIFYLIDPALREGGKEAWIPIGKFENMQVNKPYPFTFTRVQVNGWERTASSFGGYAIRKSDAPESLLILNSRCTHLSCTVNWSEEGNVFHCPCHDAAFDIDGEVVDGPPPRALDVYEEYRLTEDGTIEIFFKES